MKYLTKTERKGMRSFIKSVLGLLPAALSWPGQHLPQPLGFYTEGTGAELRSPEVQNADPSMNSLPHAFFT